VPPPQFNLVRYYGVLAPSAAWRSLIVPEARMMIFRRPPITLPASRFLVLKAKKAERNADAGHGTIRGPN
jgi:hypothetical protein